MSTLKNLIAIFLVSVYMTGCGPGSSITQLQVSGIIKKPGNNSDPIILTIKLPAAYGLTGLDSHWGDPEDYGHTDLFKTVECDNNGNFTHQFQPTSYSLFVWFGPLGIVTPSKPPSPTFFVKTSISPDEIYGIYLTENEVVWRVYCCGNNKPYKQSTKSPVEINGYLVLQRYKR